MPKIINIHIHHKHHHPIANILASLGLLATLRASLCCIHISGLSTSQCPNAVLCHNVTLSLRGLPGCSSVTECSSACTLGVYFIKHKPTGAGAWLQRVYVTFGTCSTGVSVGSCSSHGDRWQLYVGRIESRCSAIQWPEFL